MAKKKVAPKPTKSIGTLKGNPFVNTWVATYAYG
jgi:hypothetical protein